MDLRQKAEERVDRKIKFLRNLQAYVIVNLILGFINLLFTPEYWWVLFPMFFWGIGVLVDFLKAYILMDNYYVDSYRERKIHEEMEKLRD